MISEILDVIRTFQWLKYCNIWKILVNEVKTRRAIEILVLRHVELLSFRTKNLKKKKKNAKRLLTNCLQDTVKYTDSNSEEFHNFFKSYYETPIHTVNEEKPLNVTNFQNIVKIVRGPLAISNILLQLVLLGKLVCIILQSSKNLNNFA